jgi:hypothetical protein
MAERSSYLIDDLAGNPDEVELEFGVKSDLDKALSYALDGGYRIYEADLRVALACAEANRAFQMSEQMGYHWGRVDAKEVL